MASRRDGRILDAAVRAELTLEDFEDEDALMDRMNTSLELGV